MTQNINLDHLVERAAAGFLHCRATMFALPLMRMCREDTLGLYKYSIISQTCSLLLSSSDVSSKIIIMMMICQMAEPNLLMSYVSLMNKECACLL